VRGRLAPLAAMTPLARERAASTLRAWLDLHGDVSAAAAALHVHPQTVRHRLAALRSAFDGALDDPVGRLELALALRAADQLELGEAEAP
jgi:DNA-binding PucR family transcriptional regulator